MSSLEYRIEKTNRFYKEISDAGYITSPRFDQLVKETLIRVMNVDINNKKLETILGLVRDWCDRCKEAKEIYDGCEIGMPDVVEPILSKYEQGKAKKDLVEYTKEDIAEAINESSSPSAKQRYLDRLVSIISERVKSNASRLKRRDRVLSLHLDDKA